MKILVDVVVVGAGCVGSYLATLLSDLGLEVLVVDKDIDVADSVNCSGIIGLKSFENFDLPKHVIQRKMQDIVVHSPSGSTVEYSPKRPLAYVVDRASFDKELCSKAQEKGVMYKMNCLVKDLVISDSGVKLSVNVNGQRQNIHSKMCVLATGFGSKIIGKIGLGEIKDFVQGAQVEASFDSLEETQIFLGRDIAPDFFAWIAPSVENRCKIGLISKNKAGHYLKKFLKNDFLNGRIDSVSKMKVSLLPMGSLSKSFSDRVIAVGEAAGQIKPTTFGGIYYGFVCAEIAAKTVQRAFEIDKFDESVFSFYEIEWKKKILNEQKMALKFHKVFSAMNDERIDSIVNLAKRNGVISLVDKFFDFDFHSSLITALLSSTYKFWFKEEKIS
tara:strand:- start:37275 stop:38435 length:1161 start_codon:yes stop_codon:yes gene_type:complete